MKHIGVTLTGLALALAAGFSAQPAEAAIYRCKEGGRTTFQSLPCSGSAPGAAMTAKDGAAARGASVRERAATDEFPWDDLSAGMDVASVRETVPGLKPVPQSRMRRFVSGAIPFLEKSVIIAGQEFSVQYLFLNGGLHQVWISQEPAVQSASAARASFGKIMPLMVGRWGDRPREDTPLLQNPAGDISGARLWVDAAGYSQAWILVR